MSYVLYRGWSLKELSLPEAWVNREPPAVSIVWGIDGGWTRFRILGFSPKGYRGLNPKPYTVLSLASSSLTNYSAYPNGWFYYLSTTSPLALTCTLNHLHASTDLVKTYFPISPFSKDQQLWLKLLRNPSLTAVLKAFMRSFTISCD